MKILNGTDIIEIYRIQNNIEYYGSKFLNRVYTKKEIAYCEAKNNAKYESYAARFAAKEAVYKAINMETDFNISWQDIEILNNEKGKPIVSLKFKINNLDSIDISLSHSKEYAVAYAIAVFREN